MPHGRLLNLPVRRGGRISLCLHRKLSGLPQAKHRNGGLRTRTSLKAASIYDIELRHKSYSAGDTELRSLRYMLHEEGGMYFAIGALRSLGKT